MGTEILSYEDLSNEVRLKFYKHIESVLIKERKDMGVIPFSELTILQQNNDVLNRINYFYVIVKNSGFYNLLEKTGVKHSI